MRILDEIHLRCLLIYVLHQIGSIRRSVSQLQSLFVSLVPTRLDYCNATLAGLPSTQLNRLQCRCTTCMFGPEVGAHHIAAPVLSLVAEAPADRVP